MGELEAVQLDIIGVFAAALGFGLCFAGTTTSARARWPCPLAVPPWRTPMTHTHSVPP